MSSVSIASPMRATTTTGNHSPMTAGEVEQQSKDTTSPSPRIGYATPPTRDVSKHHSSTTLESFRRKRLRINESYPATSHPLARSAGTCTGPVKLDLSNVPKNTFILATPDQVSMEMQYSNIGRARISVSHDNFTTDRILDSKSETLSENRHSPPRPTSSTLFPSETSRVTPAFFGNSDRNVTMSGMFLPIRDDGLEESPSQGEEAEFATMQTGRYRLRLKPKNLTVHHDFCRW
jgi:hypothetical protein